MLLCLHPLLCQGTWHCGLQEIYGQKCWMHSAKAFPKPLASLWKPPRVFCGRSATTATFLHCTTWQGSRIFQTQPNREQSQKLRAQGELSPAPLWTLGGAGSCGWPSLAGCCTTERILICSNRMGVRQAVSPACVNHWSPPEINAIMPIFIDS